MRFQRWSAVVHLRWRAAAWKVMIQRLGVRADACVRLGCEPGLERLAELEEPVRVRPTACRR